MNNNNNYIINYVGVTGKLTTIDFLYEENHKKYYKAYMEVKKNDFQFNVLPIIICEDLLANINTKKNINITGSIHSKNFKSSSLIERLKPKTYIYAEKVKNTEKLIIRKANIVSLKGTIWKNPSIKELHTGLVIGSTIIKVYREDNIDDHIRIITYKENALYLEKLKKGDKVSVIGRFIHIKKKTDFYDVFAMVIENK